MDVSVTLPLEDLQDLLQFAKDVPKLKEDIEFLKRQVNSVETRYAELLYILRSH